MNRINIGVKQMGFLNFEKAALPTSLGFLPLIQCLAPYALGGLSIIFLFFAVAHGHFFNEDYAVYLKEAWNIGHHFPLHNMGIIKYEDPDFPTLFEAPVTYPIGVPLLLVVPVLVFGYNLYVFKIIQLGFLMIALFLLPALMRKWRFNTLEICASIVFFCFSTELRRSINTIGSDIPFILFLLFALYAIDAVVQRNRPGVGRLAIAGLTIFLCLTIRTVAVVLPTTLVLSDFLIHRRLRFPVICIPAIYLVCLLGVQYLTGFVGESYGFIVEQDFFTPIENLHQFYWAMVVPLETAQVPGWIIGLLLGLMIPVVVGVLYEAYKGTALAVFLVIYTTVLLVLPNLNAGARYLLPHLLAFGAFAVRGTAVLSMLVYNNRLPFRLAPAGVAASMIIFAVFIPTPLPSGYWDFGVTSVPARELFSFIRETIPPQAVVATSRPHSLHLFTERTTIPLPAPTKRLADWLRAYGVSYVVIKHSAPKVPKFDFSDCPESPFCQDGNTALEAALVFKNSDFAVFSISGSHVAPAAERGSGIKEQKSNTYPR